MRLTTTVLMTLALLAAATLPAVADPGPLPVIDEPVRSCTYVIGVGEYCVRLGPIR